MNASTAKDHVLLDELICRQTEANELLTSLREASLEIELDDALVLVSHTAQLALAKQRYETLGDIIQMERYGNKCTNLMRYWLAENDLTDTYGWTRENDETRQNLPLTLCVKYQIDMLRTSHLDRMGMDGERDTDQLRRGNVLGALKTKLNRDAVRQVADELEQLLAAS